MAASKMSTLWKEAANASRDVGMSHERRGDDEAAASFTTTTALYSVSAAFLERLDRIIELLEDR